MIQIYDKTFFSLKIDDCHGLPFLEKVKETHTGFAEIIDKVICKNKDTFNIFVILRNKKQLIILNQ